MFGLQYRQNQNFRDEKRQSFRTTGKQHRRFPYRKNQADFGLGGKLLPKNGNFVRCISICATKMRMPAHQG
jgi:hypothetical protein